MKTNFLLKREILALPVAAVLLLSGATGLAAEAPEVTAFNYVRDRKSVV